MLRAIFYARFHTERGPCILHQHPQPHSPDLEDGDEGLFRFSDVSSYMIPPYDVCNRPLSVCTNDVRLLGFPISLEDAKYERNRFTFNVCFVLGRDTDARPWEPIVRKVAHFFRTLEEEDGLLQAEELPESSKVTGDNSQTAVELPMISTLLAKILEELNVYGECCIRLNTLHVLNLRLVPDKPRPVPVEAWHVPLIVRQLPNPHSWTWDLTLQRIHPHIDGINHIQRIAERADVELTLVKKAVAELLYHRCVTLLDIFHFQALYATTSDFAFFVTDEAMIEECCEYVATSPSTKPIPPAATNPPSAPSTATIIALYQAFAIGTTLHEYCLTNETDLSNVDLRRLVTFGTLKGFLRRVHKYPISIDAQYGTPKIPNSSSLSNSNSFPSDVDQSWKAAALGSGWPTPAMPDRSGTASLNNDLDGADRDGRLESFLDGAHCLDEICVAIHMSEKKIMARLRSGRVGEIMLICR